MMRCLKVISSKDDLDFAQNFDFIVVEDSYNEALLLDAVISKMNPIPVCAWINNTKLVIELIKNAIFPVTKVMLLDIKMPGVTGLECLELIKKDYNYTKLPIIMLSSSDRTNDVQKAYESHCNGYLIKDNNIGEFQKKIKDTIYFWTSVNTIT